MNSGLFLADAQCARFEPLLPANTCGVARVDGRRAVDGPPICSAIGSYAGGQNAKVHLQSDGAGRPITFRYASRSTPTAFA